MASLPTVVIGTTFKTTRTIGYGEERRGEERSGEERSGEGRREEERRAKGIERENIKTRTYSLNNSCWPSGSNERERVSFDKDMLPLSLHRPRVCFPSRHAFLSTLLSIITFPLLMWNASFNFDNSVAGVVQHGEPDLGRHGHMASNHVNTSQQ